MRKLKKIFRLCFGLGLSVSQLPVDHWHEMIGDPTIADVLLDRLVHNAHRIQLKGESMRKRKASLTHKEEMK